MTIVQQRMYIDGQFVENQSDKWIDVINPATEQVISQVPEGTTADAKRAIDAAQAAQDGWEALPAVERGVWLHKIAAGIRKREAELTNTIIAEGGKTRGLAQTEVLFTADYLDYVAEWARRYEGEIVQSDRPNENILVFKKAIGVTTGP
jgi:lactaldehyde dehydrogenase/glycolaldehyde dehydrogenase